MDQQQLYEFKKTVFIINAVAITIAVVVFIISRYAFLFFLAAMLPTLLTMAFDKKDNKSLSATICTFNLIGILPYLAEMWKSANINVTAKWIIGSAESWITVYFIVFLGYLLIWFLPGIVAILYKAKSKIQVEALEKQRDLIQEEWDIKFYQNNDKV